MSVSELTYEYAKYHLSLIINHNELKLSKRYCQLREVVTLGATSLSWDTLQ